MFGVFTVSPKYSLMIRSHKSKVVKPPDARTHHSQMFRINMSSYDKNSLEYASNNRSEKTEKGEKMLMSF